MDCSTCLKELGFDPRRHAQGRNGNYLAPLCKYCVNSVSGKADVSNLEGRVTFLEENDKTYLNPKAVMEELGQLKGHTLYLKEQVKELKKESTKERSLINVYSK
jgi:hypothetical protein